MTINDLLDMACGDSSDGMTAKKLEITRSTFSAYRVGRKKPSDEVLNKLIEMSGVDPVKAYVTVYAEKVHNPVVAEAFRHLAA